LTYGETQLLLIYGKVSGDFDIRELDEMKAHDIAYSKIVEWAKDEERDITETDIKTLNELILIRPFWKEALTADGQPTRRKIQVGEYKEHANSVRLQNGEIFHYASVIETPMKMQELMSWYNQQKTVLHPVQLAAEFHHKFVLIHPFDDGNGRLILLNLFMIFIHNLLIKLNQNYIHIFKKFFLEWNIHFPFLPLQVKSINLVTKNKLQVFCFLEIFIIRIVIRI